ncbi:MAG: 5-oxoprolinase subunit PxpB [Betaproteobacteria bacterium]|nr:5-oxoprolinase subunit PxpB [Betaproteobacteria bacterium]
MRLSPLGDAAVYAEFGNTLDLDLNRSLQALAVAIRARAVPWIRDVVPALCGIALHFDPFHPELPETEIDFCRQLLEECFKSVSKFEGSGRTVEVPVCYDPAFALDLEEVAAATKLSAQSIEKLHTSSKHRVLMVGFSPGQPYIGGLDAKLSVPRRPTPRTRMPQGSVAIANAQTAVYSYETPGGWSIIGRTPLTVFDPAREQASLFAPGDRVRFSAISRAEFEKLK